MNYYIDFEFHEGFHKPLFGRKRHFIDPISIGIVCEDGREYYAVFNDFDLKAAWNSWQQRTGQGDRNNWEPKHYWLRENVLNQIFHEFYHPNHGFLHHYPNFDYNNMKEVIDLIGKTRDQVTSEVREFCKPRASTGTLHYDQKGKVEATITGYNNPVFYGYYCDYDWVAFCSLFGKMIDLPKGFPMYCRDLKQMLDEKVERLSKYKMSTPLDIEVLKAISGKGITLGEAAKMNWADFIIKHAKYPKQTNEHNALADARWNIKLHKFLNAL